MSCWPCRTCWAEWRGPASWEVTCARNSWLALVLSLPFAAFPRCWLRDFLCLCSSTAAAQDGDDSENAMIDAVFKDIDSDGDGPALSSRSFHYIPPCSRLLRTQH